MSANFTSGDLRRLADALDAMAAMSAETGVTVTAYSDAQITVNDHVIRIFWREAAGEEPGQYLVEWPEG